MQPNPDDIENVVLTSHFPGLLIGQKKRTILLSAFTKWF